jgi:MFS transporter, AAHS family, 3-hydroxyphenylpropionic acid transporter
VKREHLLIIVACFLVAMLEGYDIQAAGVAGPLLVAEFALTPSRAGVVFSAGMVGLVIGAALGGWLADRLGRRLLLVISVAVFGAFTLAMTISPDYVTLVLVRVALGLGLGAAMPNMIAIAVETSPPELRTRTVTMMFCGMPAGGATSAVIGGLTMAAWGWRPLIVLGGLLPLVIAPILLNVIPARRTGVTIAREPTNPMKLLFGERRAAPTLLMWTTFFMTMMILYLMLNWLPLLVVGKNLGATTASAAAFWFNAASIPGALLLGLLVDRHGPVWPIALSYAGVVAAMSVLAAGDTGTIVLASSGIAGFFLLGAQYALYGVAPMFYPPAGRGFGIGVTISVGRLGSIVGPLAVGELLSMGLSAGAVALTATPVAIVAGVAAIVASRVGVKFPH